MPRKLGKGKVVRAWADRFISKIQPTTTCWIWMASRSNFGYGSFVLDGKRITAHRASWILFNGSIPKDMWVLHKCDNPPCVNPLHLEIGDRQKNMSDCVKRGRHNQASKTHC